MMNRKVQWVFAVALVLILGAVSAGCMNIGNRGEEVTPSPGVTMIPNGTGAGIETPGGAAVVPSPGLSTAMPGGTAMPYDWSTNVGAVEQRINMFSEIQDSRVVVIGNTALVGVTFTNQYKGQLTQRIHDMIAGEVQAADVAVQTVAVTSEQADVAKINSIADQIKAGAPGTDFEQEIDAIIRNATTVQ